MTTSLSSIGFQPFAPLVDHHLFGWKRCDQRKRILGRPVEPSFVVFWVKDHRHPVWMNVAHKLIRLCRDDRGRDQRSFFLSILAFEKPPNSSERKRRPRFVTSQSEPIICCRFFPLGLAKASRRNKTTARFKAGFPKSRGQQLVVTRIVHSLGLNWLSRHLGFLR